MSQRKSEYLQISAHCPNGGELVPTHAWMTPRQLERFDRQLVFFCPACRQTHLIGGPELRRMRDTIVCEAVQTPSARPFGRKALWVSDARSRLSRLRPVPRPAGLGGERLRSA